MTAARARWKSACARNGNTNAYTVLSPRQTLTSVPYAIQSLNASSFNAVALTAPLPATNMVGTIPNSLLSPNVAVLTNNVIFSGNVTATNFTGNGYGLSNVPGTSLIGIITGNGSGLTNCRPPISPARFPTRGCPRTWRCKAIPT